MIPSLHNGVSALKSLTQGLQVLGNNIANVNSLGYKSTRANYSDNFYMHLNDAEAGANGVPSNNIQQHGTGVHIGSISTDFNQGTHETTGLDLDLAIQGEALPNGGGFFEVVDDNTGEIFYTRAGAFEANERDLVVTRDQFEYKLQGVDGDIDLSKFIPPEPDVEENAENPFLGELGLYDSILSRRIDEGGNVFLVVNRRAEDAITKQIIDNGDEIVRVGQLKIVNFGSPQYLRKAGNGYYSNGRPGQDEAKILDNTEPAKGSNGKIRQYALELSNVDLTNEFASMISHQRSFQAGSRVITTSDMILSEAVNLKR